MNQVDPVAHPLVGDAAGKILVKTELEISLRIERPWPLFEQPATPVSVRLPNLFDLRASAPAWAVIIPNNLDLADLADGAGLDEIADRYLIRLAAMLSADLRDTIVFDYGVAGGFGILKIIGHGFFAVAILARLGNEFQMSRVLEIGGRDHRGVHVIKREKIFHILECARLLAVIFGRLSRRRFAVDLPKIANGGHLHILFFQPRDYRGQILTATPRPYNAQGDPIISAENTIVGGSGDVQGA